METKEPIGPKPISREGMLEKMKLKREMDRDFEWVYFKYRKRFVKIVRNALDGVACFFFLAFLSVKLSTPNVTHDCQT